MLLHSIRKAGFVPCLIFAVPSVLAHHSGQAPAVLASAEHEVGGVKVELLEVKRDSPTVVTVRWRYRNETSEPKQLTKQRTGSIDAYRLSLNSYLWMRISGLSIPSHEIPIVNR